MRIPLMILLTAWIPSGTCLGPPGGTMCTAMYAYGVSVTVINSQTGAPVDGVVLTLTDGAYTETMQAFPSGGYVGAGERPGTYTLTVRADGFADKTMENIVVTADECHVIGVSRQIALDPL